MRTIALCLILSQVVHPFYVAIREYIRSLSSGNLLIPYQSLVDFKIVFLALLLYFFTWIIEEGNHFETEYNETV